MHRYCFKKENLSYPEGLQIMLGPGPVRLGSAQLGPARPRLGSARPGSARLGLAQLGFARLGSAVPHKVVLLRRRKSSFSKRKASHVGETILDFGNVRLV